MLEYLGHEGAARAVERAVGEAVVARETTADLGGTLSTREAGEAITRRLRRSRE
jgi:3-isopropylmalate dehydrogenase